MLLKCDRQTDRQTEGRTDEHTSGVTTAHRALDYNAAIETNTYLNSERNYS